MVPLLIQAQVCTAGIISGEIIFPGIENCDPRFDIQFRCHQLNIYVKVVGWVEHAGKTSHFCTAVWQQKGVNTRFLKENITLPGLEGQPLLQQL